MLKTLIILILIINFSNATIKNISEAIDKAGMQRMLSQKIMKNYSMVGMKMRYHNPKNKLKISINIFSKNLIDLIKFNKDRSISKILLETRDRWIPLRERLLSPPKWENSYSIFISLENLLSMSNRITMMLTKLSGTKRGEIINISGNQRMLSQRLASLYMLKVWKIGLDNKRLQETMQELTKAQRILITFPNNSRLIYRKLRKVKRYCMFFKFLATSNSTKYIPSMIDRNSDKITKIMDDITKLYVKTE